MNNYIPASTRLWYPHLSNIGHCQMGEHCVVHAFVWIADGVKIGNRCSIQAFVFIPDWVEIKDDVFIGPHVCFTNDKQPPSYGVHWAKTVVKDRVSIGAGAVILPGVTLGAGCIIGAGSLVTKDVPEGETWIGNPAKRYILEE